MSYFKMKKGIKVA